MKDYDYSPTFLGKCGGSLEYYHSEFLRWKEIYTQYLEDLRACTIPSNKEILVKSWEINMIDFQEPHQKADFYKEISEYVESNTSDSWVFSRMYEEGVLSDEPYEDFAPEYYHTVDLYVFVKTEDALLQSDLYKNKVKLVEDALEKLEQSKERFLLEASKSKYK